MRTSRFITRLELGLVVLGLIAVVGGACPATAATAAPGAPVAAPSASLPLVALRASADAALEPVPDEPCETILDGVHCFNFGPERVSATYRWLGDEPIRGRLQLGRSSLAAPGCDVGQPASASPVLMLDPGDAIVIFTPQARSANWSNAFLEVDQQGRTIGVRSLYCSYWLGD